MATAPAKDPVTVTEDASGPLQPSTDRSGLGFDLFFGIIAPLLCLYFDPGVLRGGLSRILSSFQLFIYFEIAASITFLAYYLLTRRGSSFVAGALYGGAVFAFLVGIVMLPLTLIGLFALIGIAGLTPFFTGYAFLRNARRCWRQSSGARLRPGTLAVTLLGAVLVLGVPASVQVTAIQLLKHAMATIQSGSEQDFDRAVRTLKLLPYAVDTDKMARAYQNTADKKQRDRLARAFRALTGQDIEPRLVELND